MPEPGIQKRFDFPKHKIRICVSEVLFLNESV